MNIADLILYCSRSCPDRPALVFNGTTTTFGMLGRAVATTRAMLRRHGLEAGSLIALEIGNPVHQVCLILAAELCGLTTVSVQTRHVLEASGLTVTAFLHPALVEGDPRLRSIAVDDAWFAMADRLDDEAGVDIPAGHYYRIVLSSGTTGAPKAVGYTAALMGQFFQRTAAIGGESGFRSLCMLGFGTIGFTAPLLTLAIGSPCFFATSIDDALNAIRLYQIDRLLFVTVAHLEALVAAARRSPTALRSLDAIFITGSRVPPALAAEAQARLCPNLIGSYASTEAGVMSYRRFGTVSEPEGSAGYIVPWVRIETVDSDGRTLPRGSEGIIRVASPDLADYVAPDGTGSSVAPDGTWFYPGDVGYVRQDGLLVITGRASEVFNRRGVVVAPDFIERALERHPDVLEAAAFSRPDRDGRDEIWAAVVPRRMVDVAALLAALAPVLGDYTPDGIEIVESLPRTDTGKLRRGALRERFAR